MQYLDNHIDIIITTLLKILNINLSWIIFICCLNVALKVSVAYIRKHKLVAACITAASTT